MRKSQHLNFDCGRTGKVKFFYEASFRQRVIAGLIFLSIVAGFGMLAVAGHYRITLWPYPCGFKQRYGLPCPTCGMTTSVLAFVKGEVVEAFYTQPAAALLCCILVAIAILAFLVAVFGVYFRFLERFFAEIKVWHVAVAIAVIIIAGWMVTLSRALRIGY